MESNSSGDLLAEWAQWYPYTPPLGFLLREAHPERWLRIHSLPESKRLPSSGFDYAEIKRRHRAVADELLGADPCLILLLHSCDGRGSHNVGVDAGFGGLGLPRAGRLSAELWDDETGVFDRPMCVYGIISKSVPVSFDAFVVAAAEDRVYGLLLNLANGRVYAPYDGGADLIFESSIARDLARIQFAPWLPANSEGL